MKKIIVGSFALMMVLAAQALSWGSIPVYTSISSAIVSAKAQHKLLFCVTGTSWCPHCTDLKDYLASISSEVNEAAVVYYCDGDTDRTTMPKNPGYPSWGIFNPYTFKVASRWKNSGSYFVACGFSSGSTVLAALSSAKQKFASYDASEGESSSSEEIVKDTDRYFSFFIDDEDFPLEIKDAAVCEDFLPTTNRAESVVLTSKGKMSAEFKASSISYNSRKGWTIKKPEGNLSGLVIKYNSRKKSFSGTFKVYTLSNKNKLKKYTFKFKDGVMTEDGGTAVATLSSMRGKSWNVVLKAVEAE